jgi:hypothetical protein
MALWNNTDTDASKPKYLNNAEKAVTAGVDVAEAQATVNIAKGINTPGWVKAVTYTDAQGNVRTKSEVLVAMSSITGDNDTLAPEITISGQPASVTVTAGATSTFSVTASRTGSGTLTYQWQIQQEGAGAWTNIANATSASYTTGATAIGDGAGATDGDKYRVVVSLAGAESVTSNAATLTVTA